MNAKQFFSRKSEGIIPENFKNSRANGLREQSFPFKLSIYLNYRLRKKREDFLVKIVAIQPFFSILKSHSENTNPWLSTNYETHLTINVKIWNMV